MFKLTILTEYELTKDQILLVLQDAEENGEISDGFGVKVDEVPDGTSLLEDSMFKKRKIRKLKMELVGLNAEKQSWMYSEQITGQRFPDVRAGIDKKIAIVEYKLEQLK